MNSVTINGQSRVFSIRSSGYNATLGFDYLYDQALQMSEHLGKSNTVSEAEIGTLKQYEQYQQFVDEIKAKGGVKTTWFSRHAPKEVCDILERARINGTRIRLFYGETNTGLSWMDENDVIGRVGRSTGICKVPLLITSPSDDGGGAILDKCIVRIMETRSKTDLYRHPNFHVPAMELIHDPTYHKGLPYQALVNGSVHAAFKTKAKAENWIAFMNGTSMKSR